MQIERFHFEIDASQKEKDTPKDEVKTAIYQFSSRFKQNIETHLKDFEIKKSGNIFNYRTKKYSALVSQTGGFIRTIGKQEIGEKELIFLQNIFEPLLINVNPNIILYPHLLFLIDGNFESILKKFSIQPKLEELKINAKFDNSGVIITLFDNQVPVELQIIPKRIDVKVYYCELFRKENKIEFDIQKTVAFIRKNIEELGK